MSIIRAFQKYKSRKFFSKIMITSAALIGLFVTQFIELDFDPTFLKSYESEWRRQQELHTSLILFYGPRHMRKISLTCLFIFVDENMN